MLCVLQETAFQREWLLIKSITIFFCLIMMHSLYSLISFIISETRLLQNFPDFFSAWQRHADHKTYGSIYFLVGETIVLIDYQTDDYKQTVTTRSDAEDAFTHTEIIYMKFPEAAFEEIFGMALMTIYWWIRQLGIDWKLWSLLFIYASTLKKCTTDFHVYISNCFYIKYVD